MRLTVQRRLAAGVFNCSPKRVWLDQNRLDEIKEAITSADIRSLIHKGMIQEKAAKTNSRGRARKIHLQKTRGKRRGYGSRKGRKTARSPPKREWISRIRLQRKFLSELKGRQLLDNKSYKNLYAKAAGGFFRSRRHIKLYIDENRLVMKKLKEKPVS